MSAKKIAVPFNFQKNEIQNAVVQLLASDPSSPVEGQVYTNSTNHLLMYHNGTSFVSDTARSRHTGTQLAATISDFDTQVRTSRLDQMAAPSASVSMNSQRITNLQAASADSDAAQWGQVKSLVNGLDWKPSVIVAVSTNVNISSPGATLDGVAMTALDRVLLYGQSTGAENGPWIWNGAAAAMTRPDDWTGAVVATGGATFPIEQGTNADKLGICTTNGTITVNTTSTAFTVMSAGTSYVAGAGLTESPALTFNVGAGTGITVNADDVQLDTSHVRNVDHSAVTLTAGAGLTGGGDISASRTFAVGAGTGITVNADDVAINTAVVARKHTALIGDGSATSIAVTHSLGNQWVVAQVIEVATLAQIECDIVLTDANTTTFIFAVAPASNSHRVIIVG